MRKGRASAHALKSGPFSQGGEDVWGYRHPHLLPIAVGKHSLSIEHASPDRCQTPARVRSDMDELPAPPAPLRGGGEGEEERELAAEDTSDLPTDDQEES
eukprot:364723-Chlamydomonas_euryale.AAC.11